MLIGSHSDASFTEMDVVFGNNTIDSNYSVKKISVRNEREKLWTFQGKSKCLGFFNTNSYEVYLECTVI